MIGFFDGEDDPAAARRWLHQVDTCASLYQWPDSYSFQLAVSNLKGRLDSGEMGG